MGMFDYVNCHYPLPGKVQPDTYEFQSKSTDCKLDVYTISKDGILSVERNGGSVAGFRMSEESDYTGGITFYTYSKNSEFDESSTWYEYAAEFKNGKLIDIETTLRHNEKI
jgi:hypothetical protein